MFEKLFKKKPKPIWRKNTIEDWENPFNYLVARFGNLVKCDVCGCLLEKQDAIRGKSTVEEIISNPFSHRELNHPPSLVEIIVEHYYCKVHGKGKK